MSRKTTPAESERPTEPRPRDRSGRELDAWGLPRNGPARARALEKMGRPDPELDPKGWASPATDGASLPAAAEEK